MGKSAKAKKKATATAKEVPWMNVLTGIVLCCAILAANNFYEGWRQGKTSAKADVKDDSVKEAERWLADAKKRVGKAEELWKTMITAEPRWRGRGAGRAQHTRNAHTLEDTSPKAHERSKITIKATEKGVGVYADEDMVPGQVILDVPRSIMLTAHGDFHKKGDTAGMSPGLASALHRERKLTLDGKQSDPIMKAYIASLPMECPPNIGIRMKDDLKLINQTMHKWKVDLMTAELKDLKKNFPGITVFEERWATCMVLSRTLMAKDLKEEKQPAMIPFIDMLNHGDEATSVTQDFSPNIEIQSENGPITQGGTLSIKAGPNGLKKGDEITMMYSPAPSKARMLTSYGFWKGLPAATLLTGELPKFDTPDHSETHPAYGKNGCPTAIKSISISMDKKTLVPTNQTLTADVRCLRLHLYSNEEAALALSKGFPSLWEASISEPDIPAEIMLQMTKKDQSVVGNSGQQCQKVNTEEALNKQVKLLQYASPDVQSVIRQETISLMKCSTSFRQSVEQLQIRIGLLA